MATPQLLEHISTLVLRGPFIGVLTDVFLVLLLILRYDTPDDSETYDPFFILADGYCKRAAL
jgi:hypothetical protein